MKSGISNPVNARAAPEVHYLKVTPCFCQDGRDPDDAISGPKSSEANTNGRPQISETKNREY
jgi:hypothetical protein